MVRFRAKLLDVAGIIHLSRVVATLSKVAKTCVLRLTPDKVFFVLSDRTAQATGMRIWCNLEQGNFFDDYRIEGRDETNQILLELVTEQLSRALKTALTAASVKIKLTNKHTPCLTLEINTQASATRTRSVTHDIPVTLVPAKLWSDFEEPPMPRYQVSICLPALKTLRHAVDRLKNLSNYLILSANNVGNFSLEVETDDVSVRTQFKDLDNPVVENCPVSEQTGDPEHMVSARVDIRKFGQFLQAQQINPTRIVCNILENRAVHCFVLHDDMHLQYFLPVVVR
eukprot:scpid5280/ scgid9712/ Checkpoint protein HUS1